MASTLLYDLAVKTGEYTDRNGNTKGRYKNVGKVMRNDNGQFMLLDKTFNPAGVPGDGDMVMVSMFEPKPKQGQQQKNAGMTGNYDAPSQGGGYGLDDEINF